MSQLIQLVSIYCLIFIAMPKKEEALLVLAIEGTSEKLGKFLMVCSFEGILTCFEVFVDF